MLTVKSIATVLVLIVVVCYWVLFSSGNQRESFRYSILIEGGSKVNKIHVFTYKFKSGKSVSEFRVARYTTCLSSEDDLDGASISLKKLVDLVKERIPKRMWKETEVRLITTKKKKRWFQTVKGKFLKVIRSVLKSSGFMFLEAWPSVTRGESSEDTVNALVVTYFTLGSLGSDPLIIREHVESVEAFRGLEEVFGQGQADTGGDVSKPTTTRESSQGNTYVFGAILSLILVVLISLKI